MARMDDRTMPPDQGSEPNARLLRRKKRDASRGSPRFLTAQRTLVRNDNQTAPLPDGPGGGAGGAGISGQEFLRLRSGQVRATRSQRTLSFTRVGGCALAITGSF